ncbi:MAG: cytochrome c [Thermomicrobiales bacterium]|nr:cytochrome c [Thermomicrobiales bacterium]
MHKRGSILAITFLSVLIVVVACGRASEDDINKALGIVPTATLTDEQIAQATEAANAAASAIAEGGTPDTGVAAMPVGDVRLGQQQFQFQCMACHQPSGAGQGPALTVPDSPVGDMTDQELFDLVRTGEGHTGQQPISTVRISDTQLAAIIAYIRDQIANPT